MQLIGRYLSPFVRRTAATLNFYSIPFESLPLQHTGDDAPTLRKSNPVGRVPALILDDGEVLIDSVAIIDYLDREVGPQRALTPPGGADRNAIMKLTFVALGAVEKAIATAYEIRFRPEDKRHQPWVERCAEQSRGGYEFLENRLESDWFVGGKMTQADVTAAICWQFAGKATPKIKAAVKAPKLDALVERLMKLPAFSSTLPE